MTFRSLLRPVIRPVSLKACVVAVALAQLVFPGTLPAYAVTATESAACTPLPRSAWAPERICIGGDDFDRDVCSAIESAALRWRLPEGFFARLIWQESRFKPNAVSPAGAMGIAQFMPGTARLRGLDDAFNPAEALARSAEYLRFLTDKFGNLGLAAAAYNAGEGRIGRFVSSNGYLPYETENYVRIVTGLPIGTWLAEAPPAPDFRLDKDQAFLPACLTLASTRSAPDFDYVPAEYQPWGVQLAADFNPNVARRMFERVQARYPSVLGSEAPMLLAERNPSFGRAMRYHARVGRPTRDAALELCRALSDAGGICTVVAN